MNVGGVAAYRFRGATVISAIGKHPVAGPVRVRGVNLDGDDQADRTVHGGPRKAVYAYPSEHYEWWSARYAVPPRSFGFVGENLTLAGVLEADVAFGDVVVVGSARLLITEPRGPCYKLGMQIGADTAPVEMLYSGRTGFYLGILEEGEVQAGDPVCIHDGGVVPRVTVAELVAAFARPAEVPVERLEDLLVLPGLDADWRAHFEHERGRRGDPTRGNGPAQRPLVVRAMSQIAHDVLMIELHAADGEPLPAYEAGQFVALVVKIDGRPQVRCYSLLDPPSAGRYRIAVRRSRDDSSQPSLSRWLHANARPGMAIATRDPAGSFTQAGTHVSAATVLIAGGIGVTPMLALARTLIEDERRFAMFFGVRSAKELLFADELREIAAQSACLGVHVYYPGAQPADDGLARFDSPVIDAAEITSCFGPDSDYFICGPAPMQEAILRTLQEAAVTQERIRLEFFAGTGSGAIDAAPQEVVFDRESRVVLWSGPVGSLLDLAAEYDVPIPYSCRSGSCGTCAVRVLAGTVAYRRQPAAPVPEGHCLACIAYPTEATVLDA